MAGILKVDRVQSDSNLAFQVASSNVAYINSTGLNITGGEIIAGGSTLRTTSGLIYANNGIAFPATQATSSDPNTLDDYEEGTWTPTLAASTGSVTSYSTRAGNYVKVGRLVTAYCHIVLSGHTLGTSVVVQGLPFTAVDNGINQYAVGCVHAEACTINAWTWGYVPYGSNYAALRYYINNSGAGYVGGSQLNSNFDFMYSVTYQANA